MADADVGGVERQDREDGLVVRVSGRAQPLEPRARDECERGAAERRSTGEHVFGVKEGGIRLSPMKYTRQDVPPEVLAKLDEISKMISDGKLKVPTTEDERQNFQPPKV